MPRFLVFNFYTLLSLLCTNTFSQSITTNIKNKVEVKGFIIDQKSKQPISATIYILNRKLSVIDQVFAGKDGTYQFEGYKNTSYTIKIYNPDYEEGISSFDLGTANFFYVDTIPLNSKKITLDTIVINTRKKILDTYSDKTIYHVQNDPDALYSYAFDIIKKIPGIYLGPEEDLTINGSQNFLLLLNGRKSAIFNGKITEILQSLPASNIADIEISYTVPSKFSSEGISAVINIITKKRSLSGWNANFSAQYGRPQQTNENASFSFKSGNFSLMSNGSFGFHQNPILNYLNQLNNFNSNRSINTESGYLYFNKFISTNNEMNIEIDSTNLISFNFGLNRNLSQSNGQGKSSTYYPSGEIITAFDNLREGNNISRNISWGADYEKSSKKNVGQIFTFSYYQLMKKDSSLNYFALIPLKNYNQSNNQAKNNGIFNERTFQIDFVRPFRNNTFEIGTKWINRFNGSNYYLKLLDSNSNEFIIRPEFTDIFNHEQDIFSGYTSLYIKTKKIGFKIGSSFEKLFINADFQNTGTILKTSYFNILPSSSFSLRIKSTNFRMGFAQTVERPGLYYLNPYINQTDPLFISYGNPNLKPALTNNFDFGINYFRKNLNLSLSLNYKLTNNAIIGFTTLGDDQISRSTFENIGHRSTAFATFGLNFTVIKKINFNLNWSPSYSEYTSFFNGKLISREGFMQSYYGNISLRLNKNSRMSGNFGFTSNTITLQGFSSSYVNTSLNFYKDLGKKRNVSLQFTILNPHSEKRIIFNETLTNDFWQFNQTISIIRQYRVGFNTRFGGFKGKVAKRKKRGIQNTDLLNE